MDLLSFLLTVRVGVGRYTAFRDLVEIGERGCFSSRVYII